MRVFFALLLLALLPACATVPPGNPSDICAIFEEKDGWYKKARSASKEWKMPIPGMMAIMHQESRFVSDARPPRTKILWVIPGPRKSSAFGYPQAKDETWTEYQRSSGNYGADRDNFGDAIDFIGWYNRQSVRQCRISPSDTYSLYLAYHEGRGGFNRGTWRSKAWLKDVAAKVSRLSQNYQQQLQSCEKQLQKESSWFNWF